MMFFGNSEQAKGYALAQGEINTANALAAAQKFQAWLAANRMTATNHALAAIAHELRNALAAESERADFFQNEADKLCAALMDFQKDFERLAAENATLRAELDRAKEDVHVLALQIPPTYETEF
jgi:signal transduction histidine kinase